MVSQNYQPVIKRKRLYKNIEIWCWV